MLKLSNRLAAVVSHVDPCRRAADIGCDHGFIPVYLIQRGVCRHVIATDNSADSLEKGRRNAERHGVVDKIDFRAGDGLDALGGDEVECIIIAGMGGLLISQMLSRARFGSERLVLQPMTAAPELRRFLCVNGFYITDEDIAYEDGKYYNIIVAERRDVCYTYECDVGERLTGHPLLGGYLRRKIAVCDQIINELKNSENTGDKILYYIELKERFSLCLSKI